MAGEGVKWYGWMKGNKLLSTLDFVHFETSWHEDIYYHVYVLSQSMGEYHPKSRRNVNGPNGRKSQNMIEDPKIHRFIYRLGNKKSSYSDQERLALLKHY